MAEEPAAPAPRAARGPADPARRDARAEHNGAAERAEEARPPEPPEEGAGEERADGGRDGPGSPPPPRGSPQAGRRYVQVMGSGLLAEMKAKQERRAASAHKKLGNDILSQEPSSPVSSSTERLDGGGAVPKLHPSLPETRFGLGTPEKNTKEDPRVDGSGRARSTSNMPSSPKPLLQSPKPGPAARPSVPQKPRTASRPDDAPDSPSGPSSPKVALLPPILKKVPSDKERDGQNSPQPGPRTHSQEVQRGDYFKRHSDHDSGKPSSRGKRSSKLYSTIAEEEVDAPGYRKSQPTNVSRRSWGQSAQEYQEQTQRSSSKDSRQGSKSSDSGEEAEKDFIFV